MQRTLRHLIVLLCALFATTAAIACPTCKMSLEAPRYISGGIGEAELADLRDREKDFNTKMVFADADGAYLADIEVVIRDTRGGVKFAEKGLGPILLIQLPEGGYDVTATGRGKSAGRTVQVDAKQRDVPVLVLK